MPSTDHHQYRTRNKHWPGFQCLLAQVIASWYIQKLLILYNVREIISVSQNNLPAKVIHVPSLILTKGSMQKNAGSHVKLQRFLETCYNKMFEKKIIYGLRLLKK